jgi:tellurite resistance protein TerC
MDITLWLWIAFAVVIVTLLVLDLGVFHRRAHVIGFREATLLVLFYFSLAMVFCAGVYAFRGTQTAIEFLTGYIVEVSLSFDNLFVFLLIFTHFAVPAPYLHRALFWGIFGAIVMRGAFILAGVALVQSFHWILIFFGLFLIWTGAKMLKKEEEAPDLEENPTLKFLRGHVRLVAQYHGPHFWVRIDGKWWATPMFVVLVLVNVMDVVFATDSIPAIFGITTDPFVLFTSNVFAILGLRALYFVLAGMANRFHLLHYGLALVLMFIGLKLVMDVVIDYKLPIWLALLVTVALIGGSVVASLLWPQPAEERLLAEGASAGGEGGERPH